MGLAQIDGPDSYMLSRVAESLYWMSRYLERAENTARLIDVHQNLMLDSSPEISEGPRLLRLLHSIDYRVASDDLPETEDILKTLAFDADNPFSIHHSVTAARENARQVREQVSSEMWTQINKLYLDVHTVEPDAVWGDTPHDFFVAVKQGSHLFQGITDATMNHNQGWYFIQVGRYIERLVALTTFLNVQLQQHEDFADNSKGNEYFEMVAMLKSVSAFEAYCKVYNPEMKPEWIAEFLLFNSEFPRSARFCADGILNALDRMADVTMRHKNQRVNRLAGRLQSSLSFDEISDVLDGDFHDYLMNIKRQAFKIHDSLYEAYINYSIEAALK
ncbi:MAG: alpha-E domain-containing protein [Chloroflexota bacterium]